MQAALPSRSNRPKSAPPREGGPPLCLVLGGPRSTVWAAGEGRPLGAPQGLRRDGGRVSKSKGPWWEGGWREGQPERSAILEHVVCLRGGWHLERSISWPVLGCWPLSLFLMLFPSLSTAVGPTALPQGEMTDDTQLIPVTRRVGVSGTPTKQGPTRPGCLTDGNRGSTPPRPWFVFSIDTGLFQ